MEQGYKVKLLEADVANLKRWLKLYDQDDRALNPVTQARLDLQAEKFTKLLAEKRRKLAEFKKHEGKKE